MQKTSAFNVPKTPFSQSARTAQNDEIERKKETVVLSLIDNSPESVGCRSGGRSCADIEDAIAALPQFMHLLPKVAVFYAGEHPYLIS